MTQISNRQIDMEKGRNGAGRHNHYWIIKDEEQLTNNETGIVTRPTINDPL
ncbi:MAG: hypothetical protein ABIL02_05390 [candidate division WOR-3 bacterium]